MTDDEYRALLFSLAAKHVRAHTWLPPRAVNHAPRPGNAAIDRGPDGMTPTDMMNEIAVLVSLSKAAAHDREEGAALADMLAQRLQHTRPVQAAESAMRAVGILDAIDEAHTVVFREFRRSMVPDDELHILRTMGFTDPEIHILLTLAVEETHALAKSWPVQVVRPVAVGGASIQTATAPDVPADGAGAALHEAAAAVARAADRATGQAPEKRRKLCNGIGKVLAGAAMGIGNALVAAGAVVAPNPAIGATVIASGATAIGTIMAGVGDLRGE